MGILTLPERRLARKMRAEGMSRSLRLPVETAY